MPLTLLDGDFVEFLCALFQIYPIADENLCDEEGGFLQFVVFFDALESVHDF